LRQRPRSDRRGRPRAGPRRLLQRRRRHRGGARRPRGRARRSGRDERGLALVDGEHVYEAHSRIAEPGDVVLVAPGGETLTQEALARMAGDRGLDGLLDAVAAAAQPVARAA
jgi:hypothetical protein